MSYLIVHLTLAIPYMILGETALSFIGIGLRPPVVSWGVMLQQAQNVRTISLHPWLLIPACSWWRWCCASTSSATACATPPTPTAVSSQEHPPAAVARGP